MTLYHSKKSALFALMIGASSLLSACSSEVIVRGQQVSDDMLAQVPVGSSQEQVIVALGTPSTTSTISGQTFYYVSQRVERRTHFTGEAIRDQRVVAIYFDKNRRVSRIANYGLQDGQVFDFVSRTTAAGGDEQSFLKQIFRAANFNPGF